MDRATEFFCSKGKEVARFKDMKFSSKMFKFFDHVFKNDHNCNMKIKSKYQKHFPFHRGAFCQFLFLWIYYCHSSKSTGKETCKTHLCAFLRKKNKEQNEIKNSKKLNLLQTPKQDSRYNQERQQSQLYVHRGNWILLQLALYIHTINTYHM